MAKPLFCATLLNENSPSLQTSTSFFVSRVSLRCWFTDDCILPSTGSVTLAFSFLPEVVADGTPSVQVVLNSDTKRLNLLKELEVLREKVETSHDADALDRYNEVRFTISTWNTSTMWF